MDHPQPPFRTLRPPDTLPHHRSQTHEWEQGQRPRQGLGSRARSSPRNRCPGRTPRFLVKGPALTCAPSPQTTRCRISLRWASWPQSCCSSGSFSARLGTTAEEPETRPGAEHGGSTPPRAQEPGTPASSPEASGRACATHAWCAVCRDPWGRDAPRGAGRGPGAPGGSASAHGGALPPREDALSPLTPGPRRVLHGRGGSSPCTPAGSVQSHGGREPHCSYPPSLVCTMTSIPSQKHNVV